jgi:hypothetical protein
MRFKVAALLILLLSTTGMVLAQETTGTITGRVVDAQGLAVPGVTVTATGPQGSKAAVTEADGRFSLRFLTPGAYEVQAQLQGFKTFDQANINVSLGQTVDLAVKLEVGGLTETVRVEATAPVVDTKSTTTGAVLSNELFDRVPVGRRLSDTLYLAPGVSSSNTLGSQNPSVSGGSGLENQYVVDGVNITNGGYGALGSFSITYGSLGNATPFDFIKEVQVKTGGYEAEFGQSTGGVVNVVTKSGSNDLRGSLFAYTRPEKTEGTWTIVQTPNGTVQSVGSHAYDGGVEGGGPIMKDRLFFFGAVDPSRDVRTYQAPAGFPLLSLGNVDRVRDAWPYSAKATYQVNGNHRLDASFFGDPTTGLSGPQRASAMLGTTTAQFSTLSYGGHNQTVRYNGVVRSSWLLEAYYARAMNDFTEQPSIDQWQVRDRTVTPNIRSGGLGSYEANNHSISNQYVIKSTNVIAGHEIRYGFEWDNVSWLYNANRTGPTFLAANGQQTTSGAQISIISDPVFGKIYRVDRANLLPPPSTTQDYQDAFIQDTWRVGSRLTINPGLRWEQETMNGTGLTFKLKNNWAPRIGATYDPIGDAKTKIYGNWGRFYARVPNDLAARSLSGELTITRGDYFDVGLTRPVPAGTLAGGVTQHFLTSGSAAGDVIDPNAKMSYINEFVLGVEREVMPNTSVGVRYVYRNIGRILEDIANCPAAAYDLYPAACASVEYILTNPTSATPINPAAIAANPVFAGVKFDDPTHVYHAVEVTLNRRLSNNWSAIASYRWSRLRGNFDGFYRDDNGQSDPAISTLYDFPTNDPTYTQFGAALGYPGDIRFQGDPNGILPLDRPHQIKLFGNYELPFGLNIGIGENLSSGKPLTPLAPHPIYGNGGEIPTAPHGSGIQTTTDGFLTRTPFQSQTDVQAAYIVKINGRRQFTVLVDIFNLFNQQIPYDYDQWTALSFGAPANPNFGTPTSSVPNQVAAGPQIQTPRQIRFGARFSF